MELLTSSLFTEVDSYFSVSHKVLLEIRNKLNEGIKSDLQLSSQEKTMDYINLTVSTSRKTLKVKVVGPDFNWEDRIINWVLWLPHTDIVDSNDQVPPYLKYYFDALVVVFKNYGIFEEKIRKIQREVENEVINNDEYKYDEDNIDLDLSDLDLS